MNQGTGGDVGASLRCLCIQAENKTLVIDTSTPAVTRMLRGRGFAS
jgi:hypothetical protein